MILNVRLVDVELLKINKKLYLRGLAIFDKKKGVIKTEGKIVQKSPFVIPLNQLNQHILNPKLLEIVLFFIK